MEDPLVSIVIPLYNSEKWIEETLRSAANQTYGALEILVVDDGSTDRGPDLVLEQASRDDRIRLIRQENKGVGHARNRGIEEAGGEFIAPLDSDDLWLPTKVESQVKRFLEVEKQGRPVGMVYCWSQTIDEDSVTIRRGMPRKPLEGDVFDELVVDNFIGNGSSPLMKTSVIREFGGYLDMETYGCEDLALSLMIASRYEVFAVPEYLVGYRRLSSSQSGNSVRMERSLEEAFRGVSEIVDIPRAGLRDCKTAMVLWMLAKSGLFSEEFFAVLRRLIRHDPLFMLRKWTLRSIYRMVASRIQRIRSKMRGDVMRYGFLSGKPR